MSGRYGNERNDPLAALNLPAAIQARALKLLERIQLAHAAEDLFRASDRAEEFVLGIETVRALGVFK